jgi:ectoine hydroxylase-related dioxygenase (phytanoyl-CoA dioxygenase family)
VIEDLSQYHRPVGDLFPWPASRDEWSRFRLSAEQVRRFHEQGYLAGVRVLDERQIQVLRAELEEIMNPEHPGNPLYYEFHSDESADPETVLFHALGAWRISPGFHDILWNPAFLMPAYQLLGGPVRFWHDQLFCKPPRHGGVVAWHQDYSYWTRTVPLCHLTCWIGLDDATVENGCLQYVPGSHRWNLLPITGLAGAMKAIEEVLTDEQRRGFQPVAVELKAGECVFHHALTVHGSDRNRSALPRRGVVINVARDGVRSATAEPLLDGVPALGADQPLGGRFFPLLFAGV